MGHKHSMTLDETVASITSPCTSRIERLKRIKAFLDATETAMFNSAVGGVVKQYRVNTGQTVIDVEATDFNSLQRSWERLNSLYNEMCGICNGSNVMVMRSASANTR